MSQYTKINTYSYAREKNRLKILFFLFSIGGILFFCCDTETPKYKYLYMSLFSKNKFLEKFFIGIFFLYILLTGIFFLYILIQYVK